MQVNNSYVGRFAPSPTGPLHFGSLVAALASYLDARANAGQWLLRLEDLDPPRESTTAAREIIEQLLGFQLRWDGDVTYQSQQLDRYQRALNQLEELGLIFPCTCSRKNLPLVYPGTCRQQNTPQGVFATRIRVNSEILAFDDLFRGKTRFDLQTEVGDFIIRRKDGLFAYQLAVVIDDAEAGITHVVRGVDLIDSTPKQLYLYQQLQLSPPAFGHVPLILGGDGHKLSKQAHASPVEQLDKHITLNRALDALGQPRVSTSNISKLLDTAIQQWNRQLVPNIDGISYQQLVTMVSD